MPKIEKWNQSILFFRSRKADKPQRFFLNDRKTFDIFAPLREAQALGHSCPPHVLAYQAPFFEIGRIRDLSSKPTAMP